MGAIPKIVEVIAPESAVTGESILIGGRSVNQGDLGVTYVRFVDRDTGEIIPIAMIHQHQPGGTEGSGGAGYKDMPARSWRLRCEVGEGTDDPESIYDPPSITDSRDLTILNPEYPLPTPLVEGLKIGIPISTGFAWTTFLYTGNIQTAGLAAIAGLIIPAAIKLAGKTSPSEPPEESDAFNFLY